ncbi:hypothetical protein J2X32_002894 [Rheinheimera pacifica]|nr:hypothetical protein [Rheinheimera pacifica]
MANADNTLTVAITDNAGNRNDEAAITQVSRKFAPSTFSYDTQTKRLYAVVENNELVSTVIISCWQLNRINYCNMTVLITRVW